MQTTNRGGWGLVLALFAGLCGCLAGSAGVVVPFLFKGMFLLAGYHGPSGPGPIDSSPFSAIFVGLSLVIFIAAFAVMFRKGWGRTLYLIAALLSLLILVFLTLSSDQTDEFFFAIWLTAAIVSSVMAIGSIPLILPAAKEELGYERSWSVTEILAVLILVLSVGGFVGQPVANELGRDARDARKAEIAQKQLTVLLSSPAPNLSGEYNRLMADGAEITEENAEAIVVAAARRHPELVDGLIGTHFGFAHRDAAWRELALSGHYEQLPTLFRLRDAKADPEASKQIGVALIKILREHSEKSPAEPRATWLVMGGADLTVKDEGRTALDEAALNPKLYEIHALIREHLHLYGSQDYGLSDLQLKADRNTTYTGACPITIKFSAEFRVTSYGSLLCRFAHEWRGGDPPPGEECKVAPGLNRFEESRTVGEPGARFTGSESFHVSGGARNSSNVIPIELSCQ